jgi:tetratricopeptide (TPR) repeat protein
MTARSPERDHARLLGVQAAIRAGDVAEAGRLAGAALADGLDHPLLLGTLAAAREQEGRLDEALALLERMRAADPDNPNLLNGIGRSLLRLERLDEALAALDAALALAPGMAKALANRGLALVALARLDAARADFEAALAADPANLAAADGLAGLALRRGETKEARRLAQQVLAARPGLPGPALTAAGADLAEGKAAEAEATARAIAADARTDPRSRALAFGLLGDALDAQGQFPGAFAAWGEAKALLRDVYRSDYEGRAGTSALLRALTGALTGRQLPPPPAAPHGGGASGHVFLLGFPRSGTTLIEQALDQHSEIVTLAERECLADASRAWLGDPARFIAFLAADEAALAPYRDAYWRRVRAEGVDPAGRVLVDKHPFHSFRLPLIARLFPGARILFARRDPRDILLSCFRHHFQMTAPVYRMLTLAGIADLYAAAMALTEACETAFGLDMHPVAMEAVIADFDGETRAICDHIGVAWTPALRDFAAAAGRRGIATPSGPQLVRGLSARGVGRWRDYAAELAPALPLLDPWTARFGVD